MIFDFSKSVHNSSCHRRFPRIGIIGHPRLRVIPTCAWATFSCLCTRNINSKHVMLFNLALSWHVTLSRSVEAKLCFYQWSIFDTLAAHGHGLLVWRRSASYVHFCDLLHTFVNSYVELQREGRWFNLVLFIFSSYLVYLFILFYSVALRCSPCQKSGALGRVVWLATLRDT